ncbi:hypothetical protein TR2A62_0719 [Thalassobium sp. R2A62]|nr:hypothetical protein TR2A62_0719 [Thalassobium sp. R2A62]
MAVVRDKAGIAIWRINGCFSIFSNVVSRARIDGARCLAKRLGLKFAECATLLPA